MIRSMQSWPYFDNRFFSPCCTHFYFWCWLQTTSLWHLVENTCQKIQEKKKTCLYQRVTATQALSMCSAISSLFFVRRDKLTKEECIIHERGTVLNPFILKFVFFLSIPSGKSRARLIKFPKCIQFLRGKKTIGYRICSQLGRGGLVNNGVNLPPRQPRGPGPL